MREFSFEHPAILKESDVDTLLVIEQEAFPIDCYNREQLLEEYEKDPMLFIVSRNRDQIPVGYVSGNLEEQVGTVVSLAVDRRVRKMGIGNRLCGLMIDYLIDSGVNS